MNPVSKAIADIKRTIPADILRRAFLRPENGLFATATQSIDEAIRREVIWGRVMEDTNLVGGQEVRIEITGMMYEQVNALQRVYRIPKDKTGGKSITSVLNVTYGSSIYLATSAGMASMGCSSSGLTDMLQTVLNSSGSVPDVGEATCQLIGENVILVEMGNFRPYYMYLRCIVSQNPNLEGLQLRSYIDFSQLCQFACKSYIYNKLIIQMGDGQLQGGQQLGVFKEIVDRYSDAEELYMTFLKEKWTKIMFMNSGESMSRFIRSQIGAHR